jgi:hypothetical protein
VNTATRVGAFVLAVAAVFGMAYGAGRLVGPVEAAPSGEHSRTGRAEAALSSAPRQLPVAGLLVARDGYRLVLISGNTSAGLPGEFAFRILDPQERPVTSFAPVHGERMHLVLVRRDLSGFQHVHPVMDPDGTWRIPLTFEQAGDYRALVDFLPTGHGAVLTLGTDVRVGGEYRPQPLPEPARTATVDGYTVDLGGRLTAGRTSELALTISREGRPVTDLQPYLGTYGHLIALRDGDLAYLHVHPTGRPGDGIMNPGPQLTFTMEVPSAGSFRLYLEFRHGDRIRTAVFTATASDDHGGH